MAAGVRQGECRGHLDDAFDKCCAIIKVDAAQRFRDRCAFASMSLRELHSEGGRLTSGSGEGPGGGRRQGAAGGGKTAGGRGGTSRELTRGVWETSF